MLMANTINTGTRLIDESALLRESLRSESEPWTSFYMAGEVYSRITEGVWTTKQVRERRQHGSFGQSD